MYEFYFIKTVTKRNLRGSLHLWLDVGVHTLSFFIIISFSPFLGSAFLFVGDSPRLHTEPRGSHGARFPAVLATRAIFPPVVPTKNLISLCWFWLDDEKVLKPNSLSIGVMGQGWKGLGSIDRHLENQITLQRLPGQMWIKADRHSHVYLLSLSCSLHRSW